MMGFSLFFFLPLGTLGFLGLGLQALCICVSVSVLVRPRHSRLYSEAGSHHFNPPLSVLGLPLLLLRLDPQPFLIPASGRCASCSCMECTRTAVIDVLLSCILSMHLLLATLHTHTSTYIQTCDTTYTHARACN